MRVMIGRAALAGSFALLGLASCTYNETPPPPVVEQAPPVIVQQPAAPPPPGSVVVTPKSY